jgi:hypothetical protein
MNVHTNGDVAPRIRNEVTNLERAKRVTQPVGEPQRI